MIVNGKDLNFDQSSSGLPNVVEGVLSLFQPVTVGIIRTSQVNGYTQTIVETYIKTKGVRIQRNNELVITKTGQRLWDYVDIYFVNDLELVADDLFLFHDTQYRVIASEEWREYGFNKYSVVEDFTKLYNPNSDIL